MVELARVDMRLVRCFGKKLIWCFTDISSQRTVVWPDVHALVSVLRVLGFGFFG